MKAAIYRIDGNERITVAQFINADDALRCFKAMAYSLGERLVMVVYGPSTVTPPRGCHLNGNSEYVLNPAFAYDNFTNTGRS